MEKFLVFLLWLMLGVIVFMLYCIKFRNPYRLELYFGKKGAGKSTLLVKKAWQYNHSKRWNAVYCNTEIAGTRLYDVTDIGRRDFPENSVVMIDEVSLVWHCRDFRNFSKDVQHWFRKQRHKRVKVIMVSQSFDVDKVLRDLCDSLYLISCHFNVFSVAKKITKYPDLRQNADGDSRLVDGLEFEPFALFWAGSREYTFIPHWVKYHDSFEETPMESIEYTLTPYPVMPKMNFTYFKSLIVDALRRFESSVLADDSQFFGIRILQSVVRCRQRVVGRFSRSHTDGTHDDIDI